MPQMLPTIVQPVVFSSDSHDNESNDKSHFITVIFGKLLTLKEYSSSLVHVLDI